MNILCFSDFFNENESMQYAVIKLSPDFPGYEPGDDIDIFCRDVELFANNVLAFLKDYVGGKFSIRTSKAQNKVQIDLLDGEEIHFRFDLIGNMPDYKNIKIKPSFFDVVIENAVYKEFDGFNIKVPQIGDECILRYMEYIEYFDKRPDKIKHTDYINRLVEKGLINNNIFFDRLYYYTQIPEQVYRSKSLKEKILERLKLTRTLFTKAQHLLKVKGFSALVKKVLQRFK